MKKWKSKWKKNLTMVGILAALIIPNANPASAAAGWQTLYSNSVFLQSTGCQKISVSSGGGSFRVQVTEAFGGTYWRAYLSESDGTTSTSLGSKANSGNTYVQWDNISNYIDGADNKAELNVCIGDASFEESVHVELLD